MGQDTKIPVYKCSLCGWDAVTNDGVICSSIKTQTEPCGGHIIKIKTSVRFYKFVKRSGNGVIPSTFRRIAKAMNIHPSTVHSRVYRGWTYLEAFYGRSTSNVYVSEPKNEPVDYYPVMAKERRELNMQAVSEFLNPTIGDGEDMDYLDTDVRINALKRSFKLLYKK